MTGLEALFGPIWPYALVLLLGFLPSEVWRVAAALLARRIDAASEVFLWVRAVATTLVAAVVVKLLLQPPEALALVPVWGRAAAVLAGIAAWRACGRSVPAGVAAGSGAVAALAAAAA